MKMKQEETEELSTNEHLELEVKITYYSHFFTQKVPECCLCRDISESYETAPIALISYSQYSYNLEVYDRRFNPRDSPLTPQVPNLYSSFSFPDPHLQLWSLYSYRVFP